VLAVYTAEDLGEYWKPGPLLVPPPPIEGAVFNERTQVPLAKDKVRHAGEPVALVLAESRYLAEDAAAEVLVDYEPLPAVVDLERALARDAPRVHDHVPGNVAAHVRQARGNYAEAKARAHLVIRRRFFYDRGTSSPIETRGVVAQWDAKADRLTVWDTTQAPVVIRDGLAAMLGLSERQVRVVAPFIGGGFGPKIMMFYPEEVLVPWAAMQLERPVKWRSTRRGRSWVSKTCFCTTPAPTIHTASPCRSTASARCSAFTSCRLMTAPSPPSSPRCPASRPTAARDGSTASS
jgi:CO/xanthine dehydrogenase Mo-binding subunit